MQCTALNWTTLHCTAPHFTAQRFYWSVLHYTALKKLSYRVILSRYCNKLQLFAVYLYCSSSVLLPTPVYSSLSSSPGTWGWCWQGRGSIGTGCTYTTALMYSVQCTALQYCTVYSVQYCNNVHRTVHSVQYSNNLQCHSSPVLQYCNNVQCTVYSVQYCNNVQCLSTSVLQY